MLRDGLNFYCIDCWAEIEPCLASLCSMRCQDCRDGLAAPVSGWSDVGNDGFVNPSEPWHAWFVRTMGVPA